jgi:chromosome partitioning protein
LRRVAVINQKGGVGKTTTTVNHGAALARLGKRVLLIDMDPQANLTLHLDRRPGEGVRTLTDLLVDGAPLREMIQETRTPGLAVVPADTSLAGVEQVLANRIGRETILREALEEIEDLGFDFVLLDCPPSLGVLSANALVAADEVLIPLQTEYFALQGMAKLMDVIELVRRRLNPGLRINCLLPCMVDQRTRLSGEVLEEIRRHFGELLARNRIRMNVKLAEAPSFGRTIFEHAPESNGAKDHEAFALEFLGRQQAPATPAQRAATPAAAPTSPNSSANAAPPPPAEAPAPGAHEAEPEPEFAPAPAPAPAPEAEAEAEAEAAEAATMGELETPPAPAPTLETEPEAETVAETEAETVTAPEPAPLPTALVPLLPGPSPRLASDRAAEASRAQTAAAPPPLTAGM